jgi:class 3 adenylate cyclase
MAIEGTWLGEGLLDGLVRRVARGAVDAVRYQPRQIDLALACGASQPEVPASVARWLADTRSRPALVALTGVPHGVVRVVAGRTGRWFGPTGSALVRWCAGALARLADGTGALVLQRPLRARVHPGMLVPHPHTIAVLALDMRGFSHLTRELHDTQYLADLVGEYLTAMTGIVEHHRGVVFQYTGDGLLALFLPELAATDGAAMMERLVYETCPALHESFDALYARWRAEWQAEHRAVTAIGLGAGLSFGRATVGFMGPAGKKHFGVIGEPINLAAFLCSQAHAGTVLVDRDAFTRAGAALPPGKVVRLRSKKQHQRVETIALRYGARAGRTRGVWIRRAQPDGAG